MTKPAKCKQCQSTYTKRQPLQKVCSPKCAADLVAKANKAKAARTAKADRVATKSKLDALKTKPELVKLAQAAFNAYIRARDEGKPCISCGTPLHSGGVGGGFDCGHYRSVGSAPHLRFAEDNSHGQCKKCNRYLSGNHVDYRAGLLERIGQTNLDHLEADQVLRRYAKEGLIEIAKHYRAMTKQLIKGTT